MCRVMSVSRSGYYGNGYVEAQAREEAQRAIFEYIEVYYNRQRKHSTNDYLAPFKYEQQLAEAA